MRLHLTIWLCIALFMPHLLSCVETTQTYYEAPLDSANYAVIDDDIITSPTGGLPEFVRIRSVDRLKIKYPREGIPEYWVEEVADTPHILVSNAIIVTPGDHKLFIYACQQVLGVADAFVVTFGGRCNCATTVIRLQADAGGRYKVGGSVSNDRNHADIWIKDLRAGDYVLPPTRIKGLEKKDCWEAYVY